MLRVAILGAGHMAHTHCARLSAMAEVEIAAVVSRRGADCAPLPGAERARRVKTVGELKGLDGSVDLALVCLPSHLHRQTVEALATSVPNIVCEKPAALSYADGVRMSQAAAAAGCNLMIAQVLRVWDSYTALAELLHSHRDALHSLTLRRRQPRPAWSAGDWLLDREKSGGILYDLAIHDIDFVTNLYGAPQSVAVSLGPGDMSATLLLRYPRFCAVIQSSWVLPTGYNAGLDVGAEAVFDDGLAVFGDQPSCYRLYQGATQRDVPFPTWDAYARQLERMVEYARAGQRENPFSIGSTLPALAVCDRMMRG